MTVHVLGYLLAAFGFLGGLTVFIRINRYRTPQPRPSWLESWTKAVVPENYTEQGRRFIPWIWAFLALCAIGVFMIVTTGFRN